ncbi:MAG: CoA transferase, partial [Microbacterium sp.]|uniref:CoA transferase n=1 Tax=Microbacterium sp. TaxID=51671 RepID=UPI0026370FB9
MGEPILDDLLTLSGVPASEGRVRIVGHDPIFATPFRMVDFGSAAIGAAALQAARLYELRGGGPQTVTVDAGAAVAALRSFRYLAEVPPVFPGPAKIASAFYETRDGRRIFIHRAFTHHLARELRVLGLRSADDEAEIARAVASWEGAALEAAIMDAGACAALVRTSEEWAAHPQGRA